MAAGGLLRQPVKAPESDDTAKWQTRFRRQARHIGGIPVDQAPVAAPLQGFPKSPPDAPLVGRNQPASALACRTLGIRRKLLCLLPCDPVEPVG